MESKGLTKAQKLLKATNAVRKTSLTEGLEEMNQYAASTTAGNFADKYYLESNNIVVKAILKPLQPEKHKRFH